MNQQTELTNRLFILLRTEGEGATLRWLIALTAVLVLPAVLYALARFITGFSRELRLLNIEIDRTQGGERRHYIRRRRRLWLSLIPFVKY